MKKALIDLFNDVERRNRLFYSIFLSTVLGISIFFTYQTVILNSKAHTLDTHGKALDDKLTQTLSSMKQTQKELEILKSQDQYKSNKDLEKTISAIESSYKKSVTVY